ncbi:hypothetical protein [Belnapia sp. F-4-1]|uniref:hypothetical protein n=1 Tax=Belnapia sp. F-4-1 TaxID=1545443 RepID=UPI0006920A3C|nr:hypothetical protein [Belnapia sp. F-4-1]
MQIETHAALILRFVDHKSIMMLREIRAGLAKVGVSAGFGTLWRFFGRHRMTRKKVCSRRVQNRSDVMRQCRTLFETKLDLYPNLSVFIDEA